MIHGLDNDMELPQPDRETEDQIRARALPPVACSACSGLGGNGGEDVCSRCEGSGEGTVAILANEGMLDDLIRACWNYEGDIKRRARIESIRANLVKLRADLAAMCALADNLARELQWIADEPEGARLRGAWLRSLNKPSPHGKEARRE